MIETRRVTIHFIGVWDTVGSVIIPRPDRLYLPAIQTLPFTKNNPCVKTFRHAMAIDEKRRMFRLYQWNQPQKYKTNPFIADTEAPDQDIKQVWFAGVHSDIGGGYPESVSGLAKIPLQWMIDESVNHGLQIKNAMYKRLVLGENPTNNTVTYTAPDSLAKQHDSMNWAWQILEWLPKKDNDNRWKPRETFMGIYLPRSEPRTTNEFGSMHPSVEERKAKSDYKPINA